MQPFCTPLRENHAHRGPRSHRSLAAAFLVLSAGGWGPESSMVLTLTACHLFCLKFKLTFLIYRPVERRPQAGKLRPRPLVDLPALADKGRDIKIVMLHSVLDRLGE